MIFFVIVFVLVKVSRKFEKVEKRLDALELQESQELVTLSIQQVENNPYRFASAPPFEYI